MRVTIDIPDELHARLKALAKKEGTTMRAIMLRAIDSFLEAEGPPVPTEAERNATHPIVPSERPGTLKLGEEGVYEYIEFP